MFLPSLAAQPKWPNTDSYRLTFFHMRQQPKKILTKHNSFHILEGTETLLPLHAQHVVLQGK